MSTMEEFDNMPDTPTSPLQASAPRPVSSPEALIAISDLLDMTLSVAGLLRVQAADLEQAEANLTQILRAEAEAPGPAAASPAHVHELFAMTKQAILRSLPYGTARSEALMLLEASKDKTAEATLSTLALDRHLQSVHRDAAPEGAV